MNLVRLSLILSISNRFTFHIQQIIFNEMKRAVAVQFDRFSLSYLVYARREVIVSAGAINSPQLLMLSGIGPAEHLKDQSVSITGSPCTWSMLASRLSSS